MAILANGSRRVLAAVLGLALMLFPLLPLPAQGEPLMVEEQALWAFAERLLEQGEFYRAVTEYDRLLHFFPGGGFAARARLRVGEALLRGGEAARAARHFRALLADPAMAPQADAARYGLALTLLETGPARPYPLRKQEIAGALAALEAITPAWPGQERAAGFVAALKAPPDLPGKSPWLAGTLSAVVPGAGSFYTGRYAEGSLALFVNALLFYGAGEAYRADEPALGALLGSLALVFYGGSIYAAANGAHKFNDRAQAAYLQQQRVRFGLVVEGGGLAGVFETRF